MWGKPCQSRELCLRRLPWSWPGRKGPQLCFPRRENELRGAGSEPAASPERPRRQASFVVLGARPVPGIGVWGSLSDRTQASSPPSRRLAPVCRGQRRGPPGLRESQRSVPKGAELQHQVPHAQAVRGRQGDQLQPGIGPRGQG